VPARQRAADSAARSQNPGELAILQSRLQQVQQYREVMERAAARGTEKSKASVTTATNNGLTETVTTEHGKLVIEQGNTEPKFPVEVPSGPPHLAKGTIHDVKCYYPAVMSFTLDDGAKSVKLYMNNYFKVDFYTLNFTPEKTSRSALN
jgi:hypothetical protein